MEDGREASRQVHQPIGSTPDAVTKRKFTVEPLHPCTPAAPVHTCCSHRTGLPPRSTFPLLPLLLMRERHKKKITDVLSEGSKTKAGSTDITIRLLSSVNYSLLTYPLFRFGSFLRRIDKTQSAHLPITLIRLELRNKLISFSIYHWHSRWREVRRVSPQIRFYNRIFREIRTSLSLSKDVSKDLYFSLAGTVTGY